MVTESNRCLLQPYEFSRLVATRCGSTIQRLAESSEPESHTREGTTCLANSPGAPTGLLSKVGGPRWNRTIAERLKAACSDLRAMDPRYWFPSADLHGPSSRYECVASLSMLDGKKRSPIGGFAPRFPGYRPGDHLPIVIGHVWCHWVELHHLPRPYQGLAHLYVLQRRIGTLGAIRTRAAGLRRACSVHRPGYRLQPRKDSNLQWQRS
jgi:hypothetical protein